MNDKIALLLREFDDQTEQDFGRAAAQTSPYDGVGDGQTGGVTPEPRQLDRSFASEYLDELIIAVLYRREEANGMEIIRTFTHQFGVQFSPGTVYPHLHSLEEAGILACRECVRTKEYRIDDPETARERLQSTVSQLSQLREFLDSSVRESTETRST